MRQIVNRVAIESEVWGTIFDSSDPNLNGGISWNLPSKETLFYAYAESGYATSWIWFADMSFESEHLSNKKLLCFRDNFDSNSLDTELWNDDSTGGGSCTLSDGYITLQANGLYNKGALSSKDTAVLKEKEMVVLGSKDLEFQAYASGNYWGLTDANNDNQIYIYTATNQKLAVGIRTGGSLQTLADIQNANLISGGWSISWTEGRVTVESSIWGTKFDSASSDANLSGGISWNIPSVGTRMKVFAYTNQNSYWIDFNDMSLDVVPLRSDDNVILDDKFDVAALNGNIWENLTELPAKMTFSDGSIKLNAISWGDSAEIIAKSDFSVEPNKFSNQRIRLTFNGVENGVASSAYTDFGFWNGQEPGSGNCVRMGITTGVSGYAGRPYFFINDEDANNNELYCIWTAYTLDGSWMIDWESDRVRVYRYDTLFFDSWDHGYSIPQTAMRPWVKRIQSGDLQIDSIRLSIAPECGSEGYLKADINKDCFVDILDLSKILEKWLVEDEAGQQSNNYQVSRGHRLLRDKPFHISALSNSAPGEYNMDRLVDCGTSVFFEFRGESGPTNYARRDITKAIDYSMPWIYWTSHDALTKDEIDEFARWPNLYAFSAVDEPLPKDYNEPPYDDPNEHNFYQGKEAIEYIKANYSDKIGWANMGFGYTFSDEDDYDLKDAELEDFVEILKSDVLSLDVYPLLADGNTREYQLWGAMEVVRKNALEAGLPYWIWVGCVNFDPVGNSYRRPSESDLRYLVYKALAFGYTGIM